MTEIIKFCKAKKLNLWRTHKGKDFLENAVYAAIFTQNIGYKTLVGSETISQFEPYLS